MKLADVQIGRRFSEIIKKIRRVFDERACSPDTAVVKAAEPHS